MTDVHGRSAGRARRETRTVVPLPVAVLAALGTALFAVPLVALLGEVAWSQLWADLTAPASLAALRLSLVCSIAATLLVVVLGLPLAWVLARASVRGLGVLRAVVLLPLVLPPVVGGVALWNAFSRTGLVGGPLYDLFGVQLTFTAGAVVLAEAFVALPFFVIAVEAGLRGLDTGYEEAAASLGAGRWRTFRRVTLPLLAPSLAAGIALAWARALGEFGATVTFAGNIEGRTQTLPLAVYLELQGDPQRAAALSLLLVVVSLVVLVALRGRWLVRR